MTLFTLPTLAQIKQKELDHALRALHHHRCQLEFEQATVQMLVGRIDRLQDELHLHPTLPLPTPQAHKPLPSSGIAAPIPEYVPGA